MLWTGLSALSREANPPRDRRRLPEQENRSSLTEGGGARSEEPRADDHHATGQASNGWQFRIPPLADFQGSAWLTGTP